MRLLRQFNSTPPKLMTTDQIDAHLERQLALFGLLAIALLIRLLLAAFSILPWSGWIWISIAVLPLAGLAWIGNISSEDRNP